MLSTWVKTIGALSAFWLTACASTPTGDHQYDPTKSYAWNIAQAGGIYAVQDTIVPEDQRAHFTETRAYTGLSIAAAIGSPIMGGLSILESAIGPRDRHSRPSVIAWMPQELATDSKDAVAVLEQIMGDAMKRAMEKQNISVVFSGRWANSNSYHFFSPDLPCPEREPESAGRMDFNCHIDIGGSIKRPPALISASFPASGESYFFQVAHDTFYPRIELSHGRIRERMPFLRLYSAISEELPDWVYLYIPSRYAIDDEGELVQFPFVLNKGLMNLFVTTES